jgi:hypothetical protein
MYLCLYITFHRLYFLELASSSSRDSSKHIGTITELHQQVSKLQFEKNEIGATLASELAAGDLLRAQHAEQIASMSERHSSDITSAKDQHSRAMQDKTKQHSEQIASAHDQNAKILEKKEAELEGVIKEKTQMLVAAKSE